MAGQLGRRVDLDSSQQFACRVVDVWFQMPGRRRDGLEPYKLCYLHEQKSHLIEWNQPHQEANMGSNNVVPSNISR